jgi:hypothetical protein
VLVRRKGGQAIRLAAGTELTDEITQRAMSEAELASDVRQRTPLDKEGTQGFVVALQSPRGFEEELLTALVIHDRPSKCHSFFDETVSKMVVRKQLDKQGERRGNECRQGKSATKWTCGADHPDHSWEHYDRWQPHNAGKGMTLRTRKPPKNQRKRRHEH